MADKQFNRTVEVINPLLDKLDALPTYPMNLKGAVSDPSELPETATEGDVYRVRFYAGGDHNVMNRLYYRTASTWEAIAVDSYTQYEIDSKLMGYTEYADCLSTALANVDTENSSLVVYVNTSLRRVLCVLTITFSTAWAGGSATKIGEIPLADYAPIGTVRAYAHTASYTFGMIKSSGVKSLNINVYGGEIPVNTTINAQIEWTY